MGSYTGIRFKGIVKSEFREGFEIIALNGEWAKHPDPTFREFGEDSRATFIPRGALEYMPTEWSTSTEFKRSYDSTSGKWVFRCSLKNYESTIEKFFDIIPYFIERIEYLEYFYEEDEFSQLYEIVGGVVQEVNKNFKNYKLSHKGKRNHK